MSLAYITHDSGYRHATPPDHPERADRLRAVERAMAQTQFAAVVRLAAPPCDEAALARVHTASHIDHMRQACQLAGEGIAHLNPDTTVTGASFEAALRGCGAVMAGVDGVLDGAFDRAFCAMRPPGHHAEHALAMGFCLFNSIAVAAAHALDHHGLSRVAIVDIDVHHGNGSQDYAEREARVVFASIHQGGIFPGTGHADERGAFGNIHNAPVPAFTPPQDWRRLLERQLMPAVEAFAPELILVSAGFDAHADDPLAMLLLEAEDFAWAGRSLRALADRVCQGRLVCVLEGGYDLAALEASVAAFAGALVTP